MKMFNIHSIIAKIVMLFLFMTILTIALFIGVVFYYQRGQIVGNSILNSQNTASKLKLRIDRIAGANDMSPETLNKIIKEALLLGSSNLTLYGEKGNVFVHIVNNQIASKTSASDQELAIIIRAIARQGFEDIPEGMHESMPFYYETGPEQKTISLFIPFTYSKDKNGVAAATLPISNDIDEQRGHLYFQCLLIGGLVIVLQAVFSLLLLTMVLFPLRRLSRGARQIAEGKYDTRVPIVRNDEFGQLASAFNEMSVALQHLHNEAKEINPLTGLPGHIAVFNYLNDCIVNGRVICALYCDLSNFKAYNDKYGFAKGDEVIVFTRDCLRLAAKKNNLTNVFLGHEGGDDFVAITEYEQWEPLAKSFVGYFDKGINSFYNSADARNGYIESVNRRGESHRFPLMSVSVAVVTNKTRDFHSVAEMIQVAGEVKKYVKSREGSCYAIDRRTGPLRSAQPPSGTSTQEFANLNPPA